MNDERLLRLPEVIAKTGRSRSAIYRDEASGNFPKRVKIGARSAAWRASEVNAWIASRAPASGAPAAAA